MPLLSLVCGKTLFPQHQKFIAANFGNIALFTFFGLIGTVGKLALNGHLFPFVQIILHYVS